jgi:hypothetical protein
LPRDKPIPTRQTYKWLNLLLCCTTCGNHKLDRFPLDLEGRPELVDPTAEKPWDFLDFDPDTGNFTARFDLGLNDFSPKGTETVKLLHLDRRESLAIGHRQSLKRLKALAQSADCTRKALEAEDDYGLLPYLLRGETNLSMTEIRSRMQV